MDDALRKALAEASEIVFLCTGNMVRSAFAHVYAEHLGCSLPVRSAATVYRNEGLFAETASALRRRGIDEGAIRAFCSTHLDDVIDEFESDAIVFGMRHAHLAALKGRPEIARRGFLLGELVGVGEIEDPVLEGADFEATFTAVALCVEELVWAVREEGAG